MTVFRKLKDLGYLSCYSHRGSFYTLECIPTFDDNGLWSHEGVHFSKHGTLRNTARVLVEQAEAGLLAGEVEGAIQVTTKDVLRDLEREGKIRRTKVDHRHGRSWTLQALEVNDHDFRSLALGVAIPYGIYDLQANLGSVAVGTSYDTCEFAVDAIVTWWENEGRTRYPGTRELLILADAGGSNSARFHAWKYCLQERLCDPFGLHVTVCHYPSGASKWNPIEHRLFSEISKNWAGHPLNSYETVLNHIRTTTTTTGLQVTAHLVTKEYKRAIKIAAEEMERLDLTRHDTLPAWNYTIAARQTGN